MKNAIILCLIGLFCLPAFGASKVTVEQLTKEITGSRGDRDSKVAGRLAQMELTERLSAAKLAELEAALPGPESRRALVAIVDLAAFRVPPSAEIPKDPAPSVEQQREITARAINYVKTTLRRLPNLIARRDTIRFEDTPAVVQHSGVSSLSGTFIPAQPLHPTGRYSKDVSYRDGEEIDRATEGTQDAKAAGMTGLNSVGEFGPVLSAVFGDLPQGKMTWSRWEQGPVGPAAVFSFTVPKEASHYEVRFCCTNGNEFRQFSAYHGEITIAPADGTILRLVLITDLRKSDPVKRADLLVEYGPVELGNQKFFCPVRSISVIVAPLQVNARKSLPARGTVPTTRGNVDIEVQDSGFSDDAPQTLLNDVVFSEYHLFQSESRVLTAENTAPMSPEDSATPSADAKGPQPQAPGSSITDNPPAAETAAATAPNSTASTPVAAAPAAPAVPEVHVTVQQAPSVPDVAIAEAKFSLRVTSRIVEVSVSAVDKKGQPVTDLKREDFEISDSGRKQTLRSFGRTTYTAASAPVNSASSHANSYSNRVDATSEASEPAPAANSTVIFFDATSLKFDDLLNARQQVLKIIGTLQPTEPVGLYVRIGFGFRVLLEATTDRTALAAALNDWKPDARDVARAQEAEARNRQQFDSLRNPNSVMSTYAMVGGSSGGPMSGSDPRLSNLGEQPTREALAVLVAVASHLGAIPGHKNLVWVASDNVLADWSDQSADGDEGRMSPNSIGAFSVRTQEALNNAHVSLYPFDASQLETAATDASLQNDGVQLDAAAKDRYPEFKAPPGGRSLTQLRTQTHTVQIAMQQLAESTGGRAFGRSSNVFSNLNRVIDDSKAIYQLSFAPDTQPDDKYHSLKVTVPARRDVKLRYRAGYLYSKEPATLRERFAQVLWQPFDASEISLSASRGPATGGYAVSLKIAASDVGLVQQGDHWTGKLDVFLVQADDTGAGAMVKEQTLALNLSAATYEKFQRDGIPFEQYVDSRQSPGSVKLIVVDENSGRIGSITLPALADRGKQ
jgi:VWFA-related protein